MSKDLVSLITEIMEIFSFLWFAGCLGANIFHIYNLVYEYSKYEVSTDVQYVHPDVIQVPMTVYCFPAWRLIKFLEISKEEQLQLLRREPDESSNETTWISHNFDDQTLKSRYNLYNKTRNTWESKEILGIMANLRSNSIDEQFRLTADAKAVFTDFEVFVNNFTEGNVTIVKERYYFKSSRFEQFFEIKQFMRDTLKCFSFQLREEFRELHYTHVLRQLEYPKTIFAVQFNLEIAEYALTIALGVTGNDPLSATLYSLEILLYTNGIALTYDAYESKLLEYPYQTDCRNYSKDNFVSRGDCHEKCVKKVSFESASSLNMMPAYVSLEKNESNPSLKLAPIYTSSYEGYLVDNYTAFLKKKIQEVLSFCDEKCSQRECESKKFIPKLLSMKEKMHKPYLTFSIPSNPYIVVVCQPKYAFIEFITALFSTLGFWLGVSVFGSVFDVKTVEKVLIEKKVEMKRRKSGNKSIKFSLVPQRSASPSEERQERVKLKRFSI